MINFRRDISLRWADIDPNLHMRHSVYYDFGAQIRIAMLWELGLTPEVMREHHFGPVIFREECIFKREIRLGQQVSITARIAKMKPDGSRLTIRHEFLSAEDKVLAILTVDVAWMDTQLRKLAVQIPSIVLKTLEAFPKTDDFPAE